MKFWEVTERCSFSEMWCCSCCFQIKCQFACRFLPAVVNMNSGKGPNFFSKTETAGSWHCLKMLLRTQRLPFQKNLLAMLDCLFFVFFFFNIYICQGYKFYHQPNRQALTRQNNTAVGVIYFQPFCCLAAWNRNICGQDRGVKKSPDREGREYNMNDVTNL